MRKPPRPKSGPDRVKPHKSPVKLQPTGNRRLTEQTRKILGKHYASKYRVR